ncbi:conserved hypothetical protein [Leishmania mexicana MHOM/GT/2001/U1103]|uniref:J domain-containing protein n=1 Tax=Leishmania mexicana (strain MHOM/GT/2001/U1103) TaxID=929439 RepID=E9AXD3_LEIMU|nr:conserved hypothetical protein [Leishmania mexicana MHOM/GT/2001/U1103]CBZ27624.1 conserved hypothetical protein [Leishmania mexicana MHOM/GT/2001/U1103]
MRPCAIVLHRGTMSASVRPLLGTALRSASSRRQMQFVVSTGAGHAAGVAVSALGEQRRTQYAQMPGKREQEAFLTQFDPLEVLDLPSDSTVEDIDAAFEKAKAKYGPNGKYPDAKMVDRVFQAHEILKDPDSPYYLKAHSSQTDRQRLQFQLLPKSKRRLVEFQVCLLMLIVFGVAVLVIRLVLRPMNRSIRAATR